MSGLPDTIATVRSGVFHVVCLDNQRRRVSSGTAFTANGYLVTNGHVYDVPAATSTVALQQDHQPHVVLIERADFERRMVVASPKDEYDYAVLDIPELKPLGPHQFTFRDHSLSPTQVGKPVALLGYSLGAVTLTCNAGIVSGRFVLNNVDYIEIDASVNVSNSGGPLFEPETGQVVGIVTRKATGLTDAFQHLRNALIQNAQNLAGAGIRPGVTQTISFGGFDLMKTLAETQLQLLTALNEIERSANVGIGYAFSCRHLLEESRFMDGQPW